MNTTKHTPGPWSGRAGSSPHYQGQVSSEATGATIAITYSDESGANVALIAEAPAMVAVLYDVVNGGDPGALYDAASGILSRIEGRTA